MILKVWSLHSRSVTWELVRNANSDLVSQEVWGWGPAICVSTRAPGDAQALSRARPVGLREATCYCRVPYHWFTVTGYTLASLGEV